MLIQYEKVLQAFADECNSIGKSVAAGAQGRLSLLLSNAMYLSSWERKMIDIPVPGSSYEQEFEKEFENWLQKK